MAMKLSAPPTADVLLEAFEKHADEIRGLAGDKLLSRVNFDFPTATAIMLGAHPALLSFRAEIHAQTPLIPIRYIDELDSITHAALYVYMQARTAPTPESRIAALAESAKVARKRFQADAAAAVAHELMDPSILDNVPTGNGRLEIAQGLIGLCVAFRASWSKVKSRTAVTEEMLVAATQLGVDLLAALGKDENPALSNETLPVEALWLRAASLVWLAYDQGRRGLTCVRWDEDDVADFAPSIVGPRGPRAKAPAVHTGDAPPAAPAPGVAQPTSTTTTIA